MKEIEIWCFVGPKNLPQISLLLKIVCDLGKKELGKGELYHGYTASRVTRHSAVLPVQMQKWQVLNTSTCFLNLSFHCHASLNDLQPWDYEMNCQPPGSRCPRRNTLPPGPVLTAPAQKREPLSAGLQISLFLSAFLSFLLFLAPAALSTSFSLHLMIFNNLRCLYRQQQATLIYPCSVCFVLTKASPLKPNYRWPVCSTRKVLTVGKPLHHAALFTNPNSWFQEL